MKQVFIFLFLLITSVCYSQHTETVDTAMPAKAYNLYRYTAKDQLYSYTLMYAQGYEEASTITTIVTHSKKKTRYEVDSENSDDNYLVFIPASGQKNVFGNLQFKIRKIKDAEAALPEIIRANWAIESENYKITFKRKINQLKASSVQRNKSVPVNDPYSHPNDESAQGNSKEIILDGYSETDMIGKWKITMTVANTDCEDVNEGDIKTEVWSIAKKSGNLNIKVTENDNTNDSYKGVFEDGKIILHGVYSGFFQTAKITVTVFLEDKTHFSGNRDILISTPCKTGYVITGEKLY